LFGKGSFGPRHHSGKKQGLHALPVRPVVVLHVLYENREEKTGSGFLCWKRRKGTLINPLPMIGGLTAAIGSVSRSWSFCQEFMAFAGYEDILATDGYWQ
jgi:hypothetical protein